MVTKLLVLCLFSWFNWN